MGERGAYHRRMLSELERFVRDQKVIVDMLGASLLFIESPAEPGTIVDGVEVRLGDLLRARLRLADGHETWSRRTTPADLVAA